MRRNKQIMSLPALETKRLRLRPIVEADAEGLHAAYGDVTAMEFWTRSPTKDVAETAERILESVNADERCHAAWAIMHRRTGSFAGMINYHHREPRNRKLELGWILVPAYWRQGLMAEAAHAVVGHCFVNMATDRIEAFIEPENVASLALAAKLGFSPEGDLLTDQWFANGRFHSVLTYALLAPEWRARRTAGRR
jgi:[ribosomal protein S5]-alanine N-acetyltransferase